MPCKGSYIEGREREQYSSALEGYKDIFIKLIEEEKAKKAFNILEDYYKDREEVKE